MNKITGTNTHLPTITLNINDLTSPDKKIQAVRLALKTRHIYLLLLRNTPQHQSMLPYVRGCKKVSQENRTGNKRVSPF